MDYYYLDDQNQAVGPIPQIAILALHKSGILKNETLLAQAGSDEWMPFFQVFDEFESKPLLVPVPKISEGRPNKTKTFGTSAILTLSSSILIIVFIIIYFGRYKGAQAPVTTAETAHEDKNKNSPRSSIEPAASSTISSTEKENRKPHVLAEWYDFGHHQGQEAMHAFGDFGLKLVPDRAHIAHLIKNMGVDVRTLDSGAVTLCYEGYKDGAEGRVAVYSLPVEQTASILPTPLQGYVQFSKPPPSLASENKNELLEHAIASTVLVSVTTENGEHGHGSGFLIAPGVIVTNRHVVSDAASIRVLISKDTLIPGKLLAVSNLFDVALIQTQQSEHPIIKIGNAEKMHVGDDVTAIGFPESEKLSATTTFGKISNTKRLYDGNPCFHLDLTLNHGNSGGPLINQSGMVIGINTFGLADAGIDRFNFAIKMSAVLEFIKNNCPEPIELND